MATICRKCGGIVADIDFSDLMGRRGCKNHRKGEVNIEPQPHPWLR